MKLPILLSVPHAGVRVPPEAKPYCRLTRRQIVADGDEGAAEIFGWKQHVAAFVTTDVARAIVDLNRAEDDRRPDGVVKTQTCWNVPVYREFPPDQVVEQLLDRYYRPYHRRLSTGLPADIRLGVDCHTMAGLGPPIGPDPGEVRPHVCLGNGNGDGGGGLTLPPGWTGHLLGCFRAVFGDAVTTNEPFAGGYITRHHGRERPWLQLEISRAPFMSNAEKSYGVLRALTDFCQKVLA
jgi:N-formylglutamate amidohydrolase